MSKTAARRLSDGFSPVAKKPKMANGGAHSNGVSPRPSEIDEDLHSRQLAVYGRSAMRRMALANVLIVGADGLGVEAGDSNVLLGIYLLYCAARSASLVYLCTHCSRACSQKHNPGGSQGCDAP